MADGEIRDSAQAVKTDAQNIIKDTVQSAEATIATAQIDFKKYFVVHRVAFILSILGFALVIGLILHFIYVGVDVQNEKIKKYDAQIKQRDSIIAVQDAQVKQIDLEIKSKDAILAVSRDSVASAYKIIAQLNKQHDIQVSNYKKDSTTIAHLSLDNKIRFVTGRSY